VCGQPHYLIVQPIFNNITNKTKTSNKSRMCLLAQLTVHFVVLQNAKTRVPNPHPRKRRPALLATKTLVLFPSHETLILLPRREFGHPFSRHTIILHFPNRDIQCNVPTTPQFPVASPGPCGIPWIQGRRSIWPCFRWSSLDPSAEPRGVPLEGRLRGAMHLGPAGSR